MENYVKALTEIMPLKAIWLDKPIFVYPDDRKRRIEIGDIVGVTNDKVDDYNPINMWKVVSCMGNIENTILQLHLENVDSLETKIINV
jgi:hypothetical protein